MRRAIIFICLLVFSCVIAVAQSQQQTKPQQPQKTDPDRLGLSCAQILQMSSSEWIAKITSIDDSTVDGNLRGIRVYGKCYDERTDRIAASLAKSSKGPLMGARGNFLDFEKSLQKFTEQALAASQSQPNVLKSAYAGLYEKQFRYAFYQSYVPPPAAAAKGAVTTQVPPPPTQSAAPENLPPPAEDVHPLTLAKNRFAELLGDLPDDTMHSLHAAFGELVALNPTGPSTQLSLYHYAIFLLESPNDKPFSPPPF